jgi:hypothetical protein
MRRADLLMIPLLLLLGLAAAVERRVHHVLFVARYGHPDTLLQAPAGAAVPRPAPAVARVHGFLASDAGILTVIALLAGTGIAGLFWIR